MDITLVPPDGTESARLNLGSTHAGDVSRHRLTDKQGWEAQVRPVDGGVWVLGVYKSREIAIFQAKEAIRKNWTFDQWVQAKKASKRIWDIWLPLLEIAILLATIIISETYSELGSASHTFIGITGILVAVCVYVGSKIASVVNKKIQGEV